MEYKSALDGASIELFRSIAWGVARGDGSAFDLVFLSVFHGKEKSLSLFMGGVLSDFYMHVTLSAPAV